jgi:DNA helicase-2/ATP-dependent DNA helicase PcrA
MIGLVLPDGETRQSVLGALQVGGATSIGDLLATLEVADDAIEQDIEAGTVNILTMHKAKGLTAEAVIIAATEDEYIPGRAIGDALGDERRLLYVSLTRAREYLFITYCDGRPGAQRHTGRHPGQVQRSLTQFLRHGPLAPVYGPTFVRDLAAAR